MRHGWWLAHAATPWSGRRFRRGEAYRRRRLAILAEILADPHLRDPLGVDGRHSRVQRIRVELAIHETWEENEGITLLRLHFKVDAPKGSRTAVCDVVEIAEDGGDALAAVRAEGTPCIRMRVDAIVMFDITLVVRVARNLRELHVAERLVRERLDLLEEYGRWMGLLREVARQTSAPLGRFAPCARTMHTGSR